MSREEMSKKKEAARFDQKQNGLYQHFDDLEKKEAKSSSESEAAPAEHRMLIERISKLESEIEEAGVWRLKSEEAQRAMQLNLDKALDQNAKLSEENNILKSKLFSEHEAEVFEQTRSVDDLEKKEAKSSSESEAALAKHRKLIERISKLESEIEEAGVWRLKSEEAQRAMQLNLDKALDQNAKLSEENNILKSKLISQEEKHEIDVKEQVSLVKKNSTITTNRYAELVLQAQSELNALKDEQCAQTKNLCIAKKDAETYRSMIDMETRYLDLKNADSASITIQTKSAAEGYWTRQMSLIFGHWRLTTHGSVLIRSFDYTKLCITNTATEAAILGSWVLVCRAGGNEIAHKFADSIILHPGGTIEVWSASSGHEGHLPDSVTMSSNWPMGADPFARLDNSEGVTVSTMEMVECDTTITTESHP